MAIVYNLSFELEAELRRVKMPAGSCFDCVSFESDFCYPFVSLTSIRTFTYAIRFMTQAVTRTRRLRDRMHKRALYGIQWH